MVILNETITHAGEYGDSLLCAVHLRTDGRLLLRRFSPVESARPPARAGIADQEAADPLFNSYIEHYTASSGLRLLSGVPHIDAPQPITT
jgi:hypothetical protein